MVKRLLEATARDMRNMSSKQLLESIRLAEGRTILTEVVSPKSSFKSSITPMEYAAAFGADLIALNVYDVNKPSVGGLPQDWDKKGEPPMTQIKELVGRPIGLNLEPVDVSVHVQERLRLSQGRIASGKNAKKAVEQGASFICLTGNPKSGVTNMRIVRSVEEIRSGIGDSAIIMAGKMHSAGVSEEMRDSIISEHVIEGLATAGCDVVMVPAPGTVPACDQETVRLWVKTCHKKGVLAMVCLDSAIEGSDFDTIRRIALASKMAGADIYHIGDAGFNIFPENIMVYSIAVKGRSHTFRRMALSTLR